MPKWLLAPRIFGLAWRGLVHRGGWTATDFLAGTWSRWRTNWPTAWRQIALRRLVLAHALPALRARANSALQGRARTNPPMVWRLITLAFVALRRIPSALSAWWAASRAIAFAHSPRFAELRDGWAMSAPLLALDLFMAGLSVFFFITIVHTPSAPDSRTPSRTGRAFAVTVSHKNDVAAPGSPIRGAYEVIATRNLFDPATGGCAGALRRGDQRRHPTCVPRRPRDEANRRLQDRGQTGWRTGATDRAGSSGHHARRRPHRGQVARPKQASTGRQRLARGPGDQRGSSAAAGTRLLGSASPGDLPVVRRRRSDSPQTDSSRRRTDPDDFALGQRGISGRADGRATGRRRRAAQARRRKGRWHGLRCRARRWGR